MFFYPLDKKKSFLWKIVTGDEKWIYYDNSVNKKQWLSPGQTPLHTPKPEIHRKKVMLCVWWDQKGIIYYEILDPKLTVTANLYSQQLVNLSQALEVKRPYSGKTKRKVILLHDNARPHVAKTTQATIENLGWEVLPRHIHQTCLLQTTICSGLWSTSSERKVFPTWIVSKKRWLSILHINQQASTRKESNHCQKDGRRSSLAMEIILMINCF